MSITIHTKELTTNDIKTDILDNTLSGGSGWFK